LFHHLARVTDRKGFRFYVDGKRVTLPCAHDSGTEGKCDRCGEAPVGVVGPAIGQARRG
jgi:hypothetical protein